MARHTGETKVLRALTKLTDEIKGKKMIIALKSGVTIAGIKSAQYTPIGKTSTLINSQRKTYDMKGSMAIATIRYDARYATYVNDKNIPQNFRRAGAKKEFLQSGFIESKDEILQAIIKALRV